MGMYDSVYLKCKCGGYIEFQSKVGACILAIYNPTTVPEFIARDVDGDDSYCMVCGKKYTAILNTDKVFVQEAEII